MNKHNKAMHRFNFYANSSLHFILKRPMGKKKPLKNSVASNFKKAFAK